MHAPRRSRFLTGLALALALFLAAPPPAIAGATRFEILASAAQTATAQGGAISVSGIKELIVYATCTASSAPTRLDVYLQSSSDGGTTWYDLPHESEMATASAGTDVTANTNKRNVLDNVTTCASAVKAVARYTNFGDQVRAAWVISGTSFTISVKAVGKN
jgi:hypothetical protein